MVINMKQAKLMAWGVTSAFLMIHVGMIIMFSICGVVPMVRFNVFSIIFYLTMMWVVHKEWMNVFCSAVFFFFFAPHGTGSHFYRMAESIPDIDHRNKYHGILL